MPLKQQKTLIRSFEEVYNACFLHPFTILYTCECELTFSFPRSRCKKCDSELIKQENTEKGIKTLLNKINTEEKESLMENLV